MNWINENSSGISHFEIHPNELRYNNIRFDIFYICCAIARKIMEYLQNFILNQLCEIRVKFSDLLPKFLI